MNVGIFIRVSTIDQAKGESPKIHEERARNFAKAKEWNVKAVYDLAGVSGKSTKDHRETQRMLEDIRSGKIVALIFSQLSRLARNTQELLYYANQFEKHEASLISMNESIDTSTSSGRFFYTIISALSAWERENNLERMMASLETRRSLGKFTGGTASFGFKIANAQIEVNEEEAPIRALMYDLFLEHRRRSTVANILNERGYRTRKNKPWSDVTVSRLLMNSDAKGIRKSNYAGRSTKDNPRGTKAKSEWIYTPCPVIVSEEKWNAVNAIIREQIEKSTQTKPLNQRVHLFTGYLHCHNEHRMAIQSKTNKYSCPKCKVRIDKDDLEEIFKTRLEQFIISEEELKEYSKSTNKEIESKKEEIVLAKKTIDELGVKMDRLIILNIDGQIPTKGFKQHYEPIFEQKEQLFENIKQMEMELSQMMESKNSFSLVVDKSKNLYQNWDNLDRPEKRFIVQSVTNKVEFDGKNIKFNLKQIAPLSALEMGTNGQHSPTILSFGERQQTLLSSIYKRGANVQ